MAATPLKQASLVLVLACLAVFWPVLPNGFVHYDDFAYLHENPVVNGGLGPRTLHSSLFTAPQNNWMPLTWLLAAVEVQAGGLMRPWIFHGVSLALHTLNSVLILHLLRRMVPSTTCALAGALIFAVHPLRVETVAWASAQKDLLAAAFLLTAALIWLRAPAAKPATAGRMMRTRSTLLYAASLASKQSGVSFPAVILLWERLCGGGEPLMRSLRRIIPLIVLTVTAGMFTYLANTAGRDPEVTGMATSFVIRLLRAPAALAWLWSKTIWPMGLLPDYQPPRGFVWLLAGMAIAAVQIATISASWKRIPALSIGLLTHLLFLLPLLGIFPAPFDFTADRLLYLPAIGISIAIAGVLLELHRGPLPAAAVGAGAAVILGVFAFHQCRVWKSDGHLVDHILIHSPTHPAALTNRGMLFYQAGNYEAAIADFRKARQTRPKSIVAWENEIRLQLEMGRTGDAVQTAAEGLKALPYNAEMNHIAGLAHLADLRPEKAALLLAYAAKARPRSMRAQLDLARAYLAGGHAKEAREHLLRVREKVGSNEELDALLLEAQQP